MMLWTALVATKPYEFESVCYWLWGSTQRLFTGAAHDLDYRLPRVSRPFCSYWPVDFHNDRTDVSFPDMLVTCLHALLFPPILILHAADSPHFGLGLGKWIPTKNFAMMSHSFKPHALEPTFLAPLVVRVPLDQQSQKLCRPLSFQVLWLIAVRLFFAVVSVATQQLWHQYVGAAQTPISKSRQVFLKKIQNAEKLVDRGAARGVGYPDLVSFYKFFQSFIKHRSMYYVASNLVVPLTQEHKVSFAELVGPKPLTWFVSHFWGMAVPHFMESIQHHAMQVADQDRLSYWVCTFSIRQHGEIVVQEELGHGVIEQSSFYKAMWDANCCGTALVLDSEVSPLPAGGGRSYDLAWLRGNWPDIRLQDSGW